MARQKDLTPTEIAFTLTATQAKGVLDAVRRHYPTQSGKASPDRYVLLDTFDQRVRKSGGALTAQIHENLVTLLWRTQGSATRTLDVDALPAFAHDLPAGPFRTSLSSLTDVRRLLVLLDQVGKTQWIAILDTEQKTTVRLTWRREKGARQGTLQVSPLRGYDGAWRRVIRFLREDLGLAANTETGPAVPAGPDPKAPFSLTRGMRADTALKAIGQQLLNAMVANTDGARQGLDAEFLHDLRVAVRRTRAALAQFREVFPATTTARFQEEFRWLGQATGPARDYDVLAEKLASYGTDLDDATRRDLGPLIQHLQKKQKQHQTELAATLSGARYRRLLRSWATFLKRPTPKQPRARNAPRAIEAYAATRIWKLHKKILRDGGAIHDQTPDSAVHELRLVAKKLRYMMEFSKTLFARESITAQIKTLKRLQDCLGDFNDLTVHRAAIEKAATELGRRKGDTTATMLAAGRLCENLLRRQQRVRRAFQEVFLGYANKASRARAKDLFFLESKA